MDVFSIIGRPKEQRNVKSDLINILMILFTSSYTIFYSNAMPSFDGAGFGTAGFVYSLRYIPIVITTALGGSIPGMASVLFVFLHKTAISSSFSYLTFIF